MKPIHNFAIIAHVDHGKSTLADRFLEITGVVNKNQHDDQMLDRNPISRERGITIKLAPVKMMYMDHILNLIDTPGHVDFSYEVERTLACVEGAVLLVDATQGIQAQTIAHSYKALEQNIVIIPVINKIDMPNAQVEQTKQDLSSFLGIPEEEIFQISAKTGEGVENLLEAIIRNIPEAPKETSLHGDLRSLIFDSYYDPYRGVIAFIRVFDGSIKVGDKVKLYATNTDLIVEEVGIFTPDLIKSDILDSGNIGYAVTKLKDIHLVQVGDSLLARTPHVQPIEGYRKVKPMVFSSMFPTDPDKFLPLRGALEKLTLNDSALSFDPIFSKALGSGFRVGFLGLLHADVVRQRLEREYDMSIVLTSPTVEYHSDEHGQGTKHDAFKEPIADVTIVTPNEYVGVVMKLCEEARGIFVHMDNKSHVVMKYEIPLVELITHFFDRLKTVTSGYATLQWEFKEYRSADLSKLLILLNLEPIEEFSEFVVAEKAYQRGRDLVDTLRELIPKQQFEVKIQAQYKGKIIASARVAPFRKDVTAKLYGGDRTRKDKLLKKQKAGKKKMKQIGSIDVPKDVFLKLFRQES